MTDRPILFSGAMVRAILAGQKTQTRRVLRDQDPIDLGAFTNGSHLSRRPVFDKVAKAVIGHRLVPVDCPYGQPGDRLWVRESWSPDPPDTGDWGYTAWAACREGQIAGVPERFRHPAFCNYAANWLHRQIRWTPSIHMPRWATRITLEITGVRVERLQMIGEVDAMAEGAEPLLVPPDGGSCPHVEGFRALWTSINGPGSWGADPWVWVIYFKRLEG